MLVDFGQGDVVVGVLSGGNNPFGDFSEYGDRSVYAPISHEDNVAFLQGHGFLTAVPEPASLLMGVVGLAALTGRRLLAK